MKKVIRGALVVTALTLGLAGCGAAATPAPAAASIPASVAQPAAEVVQELPAAPVLPPAPAKPITERQWSLVAKSPASHVGDRIVVFGKVTQFDAATGTGVFRANVGAKKLTVSYGFVNYPTNTMISGDVNGLANLVEGDIFRGEATVIGPYSYATTLGGNMTVPALNMTAYQVIGHI